MGRRGELSLDGTPCQTRSRNHLSSWLRCGICFQHENTMLIESVFSMTDLNLLHRLLVSAVPTRKRVADRLKQLLRPMPRNAD